MNAFSFCSSATAHQHMQTLQLLSDKEGKNPPKAHKGNGGF